MPSIHYNGKEYAIAESETALACLLRHNVKYPHSCKSGTCQSCLSKLDSGQIKSEWQTGLKPTLAAQNYFLPCICKPEDTIAISLPNETDVAVAAKIIDLFKLSHNVMCLRLALEEGHCFKAGQYINLVTPEKIVRSYSIASLPAKHRYIELHIKLMLNGLMSQWLVEKARVGMSIYVRGPMGECFYCNPAQASFPIILAGTGTGLASLIGIALDALEHHHQGDIFLIHGGVIGADLYLNEILEKLVCEHKNFHYKSCVLNASEGYRQAPIDQVLVETLAGMAQSVRLFICGPEATTKKLKVKAFLAGVPSASIYSDAFIAA